MNGSTASASADAAPSAGRDLVVSVNWIGDAIMAMPALQVFRRHYPGHHIAVLARGILADVWRLHAAPDEVIRYDGRPNLAHPVFDTLRAGRFDTAWILPNSFRSAWIPARAGIPRRVGFTNALRFPLLTERRHPPRDGRTHQAWEMLHLLAPDAKLEEIPRPELHLSRELLTTVAAKFADLLLIPEHRTPNTEPLIGLIPGAARGPAKRWPGKHYVALARSLVKDGYRIMLFGGPDDKQLGDELALAIGPGAQNVAGQTSIAEWAALMARCRLIVANDSGGMHLAAALGRPLIALYGMTDPEKTGPLGPHCVILQNSQRRSRAIARDSAEAMKSLASIRPEVVYEAAGELLRQS